MHKDFYNVLLHILYMLLRTRVMWSLCEYLGESTHTRTHKKKRETAMCLIARQKCNYDNSIDFGVNDVTDMPVSVCLRNAFACTVHHKRLLQAIKVVCQGFSFVKSRMKLK